MFFLVVGSIFLYTAVQEYVDPTFTGPLSDPKAHSPLEKLLLGLILFIPGSYHTAVAIFASYKLFDFTYEDVATFESEEWWDKNK